MPLFDHLHIKGYTVGSSNELSFDVLDNARKGLDGSERKRRGLGRCGARRGNHANTSGGRLAPTGNVPFTRGTVTVTSSDEMLRNSRRSRGGSSGGGAFTGSGSGAGSVRPVMRVAGIVLAALVVIGVICAAILVNRQIYLDRLDFTNRLMVLVDDISGVDGNLVRVDALARDPLSDDSRTILASVLGELPGIESELTGIRDKAARIRADKPAGYNPAALEEVESAVVARIALIDEAAKLLEEAGRVSETIGRAESAWQSVMDATETAARGIEQANEASDQDALKQSRTVTVAALSGFQAAAVELRELQDSLPGLNLGAHLRYLDTKMEALQHALDVDDALLAQDREGAERANAAYNASEDEAASQANLITASPATSVRELLQGDLAEFTAAYGVVREEVIAADSALRGRLL